jgi:hypothetical protein
VSLSRLSPLTLVGCALLVMSLSLLSARAGAATANCLALEVRTAQWGGDTPTLLRVDLGSGSASTVAPLGYEMNGIGYAPKQNVVYGIATRAGGRLVRIDADGTLSDLGPVRGSHGRLSDAVAGAVLGSDLYVAADDELYAIGVDPSSGDFASVARRVPLRPEWLADGVDDFAVNTANGLLYGVSGGRGRAASVVSVDPGSGAVREVQVVQGLPGWADYGSVVLAGQVMYAIADDVFGQSRLYEIPLDGSGAAIQLAGWSPVEITDMAGCLATPAPPTTPPPPTPPPTITRNAPPPPPATTTKPVPAQVIPPPSTTIPPTVPTTTPPPTRPIPTTARGSLPAATLLAQASGRERNIERRWALATVLLVFGGGAVAARRVSARGREPR